MVGIKNSYELRLTTARITAFVCSCQIDAYIITIIGSRSSKFQPRAHYIDQPIHWFIGLEHYDINTGSVLISTRETRFAPEAERL